MAAKTKPKLNVRLLRRIQKHILEEPRRLNMREGVFTGEPGKRVEINPFEEPVTLPPCGTVACIAGWTAVLSGEIKPKKNGVTHWSRVEDFAAKAIGGNTRDLFYENNWPEPFRYRYAKAKTPKIRAKIAAERIDHFILTKGAE